ncbi:hypothetical protein LCGC14_0826600, partial [marine sediment metagenome]
LSTPSLTVDNYTKLGSTAPAIKMKKLTGTAPAEGAVVNLSHGLTLSKIIGFQVFITADNSYKIPPEFSSIADYNYSVFVKTSDVEVRLAAADSANINGNAVTVLITYEE